MTNTVSQIVNDVFKEAMKGGNDSAVRSNYALMIGGLISLVSATYTTDEDKDYVRKSMEYIQTMFVKDEE